MAAAVAAAGGAVAADATGNENASTQQLVRDFADFLGREVSAGWLGQKQALGARCVRQPGWAREAWPHWGTVLELFDIACLCAPCCL